jgi:hypothetical protein
MLIFHVTPVIEFYLDFSPSQFQRFFELNNFHTTKREGEFDGEREENRSVASASSVHQIGPKGGEVLSVRS